MHLFLQFNGRFTKKADRLARIMAGKHGFTRFSGVSTSEGHARWLQKPGHTPINYHHLGVLPEIWRSALASPHPDRARLVELERRHGCLWRFIIADRNLGHTFLTGTILPQSEMRRQTQSLEAVLTCVQRLFDYFEDRFQDDRPDLVFFQVVASAPALIAAAVCDHLRIPFLTLGKTKLDDRHHVSSNALMQPDWAIERYADPDLVVTSEVRTRLAESTREPPSTDHFAADRSNFQKRHGAPLLSLVRERLTALPAALRKYDKPYPPDPRASTPLEQWQWESKVQWNYRQLLRDGYFDQREVEGDYLFFALSVTPEASTCVVAPNLADQLIVISALARSLPAGWKLVIKDHLPMCGRRTRAFYDQATQYQNVMMVDPTLRSTELIRRARVVSVIAGTTGWEAMRRGKPVLTFGPDWHLATGLGIHCHDLEHLHRDIHLSVELAESVSAEERQHRCERLLQALFDRSFPFDYDLMWKGFSDRELDKHLPDFERLAFAIIARYQELQARSERRSIFSTAAWTGAVTPDWSATAPTDD